MAWGQGKGAVESNWPIIVASILPQDNAGA